MFKMFKVIIEKSTEYYIQAPRLDRGGGYLSKEFKIYYEKQRVWRYFTTPYVL
jgi:hypothetical protein